MRNLSATLLRRAAGHHWWHVVILPGALLMLAPGLLRAHATLVSSSPAPGARLAGMPARIELVFSERIESVFHSLRVLDADGVELESGEAVVTDGGETLRVALGSGIGGAAAASSPGRYAIYWRVNSLDGHQVQGHFGFGVAADAPSEAELIAWRPIPKPAVPGWYFPLLKVLSLLALAVWLGAFAPHTLGGAAELRVETERALHRKFLQRSGRLALAAGAVFLPLELFSLAGKAASFSGQPLTGLPEFKLLAATVTGSSFGQWWALRFACACMLLIFTCAWLLPAARRGAESFAVSATGWLLGGGIVASIAATGHAQAAAGSILLATLMDGLHLAASLLWAGGLLHLGLGVGEATDELPGTEPDDAAAVEWLGWLAPRFSRMAQVAMVVIILTGVYNTWLHMPNWRAFATTGYGRALLGKLFWVAATLAVASINWRKVLPELKGLRARAADAAALKWAPRFQPLLQAEFAGCVIVFAIVAMLTNMAPATADPNAGPRELRQRAGRTEVVLRVEPGRRGANQLRIQLLDAAGQPLAGTRKVMVYLRMLDMDMGLSAVEATAQRSGGFTAHAALNMSGRWKMSVEVTPGAGDAFVVEYDVAIH